MKHEGVRDRLNWFTETDSYRTVISEGAEDRRQPSTQSPHALPHPQGLWQQGTLPDAYSCLSTCIVPQFISLQPGDLLMTAPETALELLGSTIRDHRKRQGLTQKELAAKTRLGHTYISDIERGACNPSVRSLLRIAAALDLPASHLLQPLDMRPELYNFE